MDLDADLPDIEGDQRAVEEAFGGLSKDQVDQFMWAFIGSKRDEAEKAFMEALLSSTARFGYDIAKFDPNAFHDGRWLKHIILKAADESKAQGTLQEDDALTVDKSRQAFAYYAGVLMKETEAFFATGAPSIKLQRSTVDTLRTWVLAAIEAAYMIGATVGISESTKHLLKVKQAETCSKGASRKAPRDSTERGNFGGTRKWAGGAARKRGCRYS
jgi:hypothetical protein